MTGTSTAATTARVSARSYPVRAPSRSMLVSNISPAPRRTHSTAHSTASSSVRSRPPFTYTRQRSPSRAASMLMTTHCAPNRSAASVSTSGCVTATELMLTLSAPARRARPTSAAERMPPPIVSGMNNRSAVRRATSSSVPRASALAEISRKAISSAPSRAYRVASSTGSPTSRRFTNCAPFTTRPPRTSRQTTTRRVNIQADSSIRSAPLPLVLNTAPESTRASRTARPSALNAASWM